MTIYSQLGIIPAALITVAAIVIIYAGSKKTAGRRLLLFLLVVGTILFLAIFATASFVSEESERQVSQVFSLLVPAILGVLVLILLNLKQFARLSRSRKIFAIITGLLLITLIFLIWNQDLSPEYVLISGILVLVIGWFLGSRSRHLAVVMSIIALSGLFLLNYIMQDPFYDRLPGWLGFPVGISIFTTSILAVVMAAVLITSGLQQDSASTENTAIFNHARRKMILRFGLAVILLGYLAYTILWGSIWDHTSDGLFGVAVSLQAGEIAVAAGMVMAVVLNGKRRAAGFLFALLVPIVMFQSFEIGWQVSYHELTENRAARIERALARYQKREGAYPDTLRALTPVDLLYIQQPVILAGEEWCYQGGKDFYRLAAYSREFFSAPVSLQLYAAAGQPPDSPWSCEEALSEVKSRYYSPMEDPEAMRPPVPTPLPDSEVPIDKTALKPVLESTRISAGSWSPNSKYFAFGALSAGGDMTLHFLDAETGDICPVSGNYLGPSSLPRHHAWLPDGSLLLLDSDGEMVVFRPCSTNIERLTDRFPVQFTQIVAVDQDSGRILLQSKSEYWIMDGHTLTVQDVTGVSPNPYEFHWDNFAWLPGGERLAISRLNGRDKSEGSTLYIIAGDSGTIEQSYELEYASDQSAANIKWLTNTELLSRSPGMLAVIDISEDDLKITRVLQDILELDIEYPYEVSADAAVVDKDGQSYYLALRVNHPRNQALYIYHSVSGQVDVYDYDHHSLVRFPDDQFVVFHKSETEPTYEDRYDVLELDLAQRKQSQLDFSGHVPRDYPNLSIEYLAGTSQIVVASSQGISLVSLPSGEMINYWELTGGGFAPYLIPSPDESAIVALRGEGGLYLLPR